MLRWDPMLMGLLSAVMKHLRVEEEGEGSSSRCR